MKSKLLGLLGILTLISGCSNVNQKSLDPEEVVTSESKTIHRVKKGLQESEFETLKTFESEDGFRYRVYKHKDGSIYFEILPIYKSENVSDGCYMPIFAYDGSMNYNEVYFCVDSWDCTQPFQYLDLLKREHNIVFVDEDSKFIFNENNMKYVGDSESNEDGRIRKFRNFKYDFGNVCLTYPASKDEIFSIVYYDSDLHYNDSYEESINKLRIKLEQEYVERGFMEVKKIVPFKIPMDNVLLVYGSEYRVNDNFEIKTYDYSQEFQVLPDLLEEEFLVSTETRRSYTRFISKNCDFRRLIYDFLDFTEENLVGKIHDIFVFKNNSNNYFPNKMYIKFDLISSSNFEYVKTIWLNIESFFFVEDLDFKYNNVSLNNGDVIKLGYSNKIEEIYSIFSQYKSHLDLFIDGKFFDYNSIERSNSFYSLGKRDRILIELVSLEGNENGPILSDVFSFYLELEDDIKPIITGDITSYRTSSASNFEFIKSNFKAYDEKDNDVSDSLEIIKENEKNFVVAKDKSGNIAKLEIIFDVDPILYENINVINDSVFEIPENIFLTKNRVEKILNRIHDISVNELDMNSYINNSKTKGEYKVTYKLNGVDKEVTFKVIDGIELKEEPSTNEQVKSSFDKVIIEIKEFFSKLGNWFKGVFTKFKFDCFITNDEWDTKFN